jgi:hypothetical protein
MKNFKGFMEKFATDIDGRYSEYDKNKSVVIVPVNDSRFQTVLGRILFFEEQDKAGVEFSSKVCEYDVSIDLTDLLEWNSRLCYARFVIREGFLKVESAAYAEHINPELLKDMIMEVARTADKWEFTLTGQDVH